MQRCLLPRGVGDDRLLLADNAEVVDLAEAERARGGGQPVDAHSPRGLVEIDVAGLLDRLMHVDAAAVALPAAEAMAGEDVSPGAGHVLAGRDDAGFEAGERRDHLEG